MKRLISVLISICFLFSCGSVLVEDPLHHDCSLYYQYGANPDNSLIAERINNPCRAVHLLSIAAKLPAIQWEEGYAAEFERWATKLKQIVASGISYADLQTLVLLRVQELNVKLGMTLVILSEGIFIFNDESIVKEKDVELLTAMIDHLRKEVAQLMLVQGESDGRGSYDITC